jgi:maleate cis-trans isomerase
MYGWRGRLGIVLPADYNVLEPDFARLAPNGVSTHVARLRAGSLESYLDQALEFVSESFPRTRVSLIGHMCAASSLLLGPQGNIEFCAKLSERAGGLPSFTASTAVTSALAALGARTVSIVSPHRAPGAKRLTDYLDACGITTKQVVALGLDDVAQRDAFNDASPANLYRICRGLDLAGVNAVFLAATNFCTIDAIAVIEADLGLPVVTSNQAGFWEALRLLGIKAEIAGFGQLLAGR